MSKKYLIYILSIMFLMVCKPSFAMYGAIFKAARAVGVTALPVYGLYQAHKMNEILQENFKEIVPVTESAINEWFTEEKRKLNIPNPESIPLVNEKTGSWASISGKNGAIVTVSSMDRFILDNALVRRPILQKRNDQYLKDLENFRKQKAEISYIEKFLSPKTDEMYGELIDAQQSCIDLNNQNLDFYNRKIAENTMILKHELGHIVYKDTQCNIYASAAIPFGIETLSFGVTKTFRKLCNIQQPKTFIKTILRSSAAMGSFVPKLLIYGTSMVFLHRHQETQADKFACEHAESRLELKEFANFFKKDELSDDHLEKWIKMGLVNEEQAVALKKRTRMQIRWAEARRDLIHPAPVDRVEMVESYINKWDREHPAGDKRA